MVKESLIKTEKKRSVKIFPFSVCDPALVAIALWGNFNICVIIKFVIFLPIFTENVKRYQKSGGFATSRSLIAHFVFEISPSGFLFVMRMGRKG